MEADISLFLNKVQNIKTVEIKGVGLVRVRKLGSGEELALSAKMRRAEKLTEELLDLSKKTFDGSTPEGLKTIKRRNKRLDTISDEIMAIKQFQFDMYKGCLSDESDGKVVDLIMNTLSEDARAAFIRQVFGAEKQVDTAEAVQPAEDEASDE